MYFHSNLQSIFFCRVLFTSSVIGLLLLYGLNSANADEYAWRNELNGIATQLMEKGIVGDNAHSLHSLNIQLPVGLKKRISVSSSERRITVHFLDSAIDVPIGVIPEGSPFLQQLSVQRRDDGIDLIVEMTPEAWETRRIRDLSQGFEVAAVLEREAKEQVVVNTFASRGPVDPVIQVWSADVTEKPLYVKQQTEAQNKDYHPLTPPPVLRARFIDFEEDPTPVSLSVNELVFVPPSTGEVVVRNDGERELFVEFKIHEDGASEKSPSATELLVDPYEFLLPPNGGETKVRLNFIRANLAREQRYKLTLVAKGNDERESSVLQDPLMVLVQPVDGKARVAWSRDEKGILFRNEGNISSQFVNIRLCKDQCSEAPDLLVSPNSEQLLSVPQDHSVELTQVVGKNRQSGKIPPLVD
ncbi:MAG: hypothetical protein KDD60_03475 [Bdellovibrionales bacterium]|nr:hypothetical protein [Bdellovibrionales bacterium]